MLSKRENGNVPMGVPIVPASVPAKDVACPWLKRCSPHRNWPRL
jgi:hypothetical protein